MPGAERYASQAAARMNDFQRARYEREIANQGQTPAALDPLFW